jgi:hypothetical protein
MTDLAKKALTALPGLASGIAGVAKQTFTLDMKVLDDAIDEIQIANSINSKMNNIPTDKYDLPGLVEESLNCSHLKELIIKNFKEFIDEKIFHSHFHSRNQKTKNINSLKVFYRHGMSKIISKILADIKPNSDLQTLFLNEVIQVMEKLEFEKFNETLIQEFNEIIEQNNKDASNNVIEDHFINTIMDDAQIELLMNNTLITQDMKDELFYTLFKDDFDQIIKMDDFKIIDTGFTNIDELQDFYDKIEFKQKLKEDEKNKEELKFAHMKGIRAFVEEDKTPKKSPKKTVTTYVSADS